MVFPIQRLSRKEQYLWKVKAKSLNVEKQRQKCPLYSENSAIWTYHCKVFSNACAMTKSKWKVDERTGSGIEQEPSVTWIYTCTCNSMFTYCLFSWSNLLGLKMSGSSKYSGIWEDNMVPICKCVHVHVHHGIMASSINKISKHNVQRP